MDTEVARSVVKEAYDYFWQLLETSPQFRELVPPENRVRHIVDEKTAPDTRANPKKPAVFIFPSVLKTNFTLSSDHIEVLMAVDVMANVHRLAVTDLLELYEVVICAIDQWREDALRPESLRRIEAQEAEVRPTRGYPQGWFVLARFSVRVVLTRSKEE